MASTLAVDGRWDDQHTPTYLDELLETLRVVGVVGIGWGLVCLGLGGRLAMFLLRLTSPDYVRGVLSDDGFVIGRFTLSGTYNLAVLGAALGVIGAAAYVAVAPWLIGSPGFRRFTVALTSAAIGGSGTIHYDGIDFHALKPQAFALGLFLVLPFVFGYGVATLVDRVAERDSWTRRGKTAWVLPVALLVLIAANPLAGVVPIVAAIISALLVVRRLFHRAITSSPAGTLAARTFYFVIALYSFSQLGMDLADFA
jgi:hypothetical protein